MDTYLSEARKKAVKNAKKKAIEYAGVLDQKVGKAMSISEHAVNVGGPRDFKNMQVRSMAMAESDSNSESISIGEMLVTSKVNITFVLE